MIWGTITKRKTKERTQKTDKTNCMFGKRRHNASKDKFGQKNVDRKKRSFLSKLHNNK
jgi:hypothetical protein